MPLTALCYYSISSPVDLPTGKTVYLERDRGTKVLAAVWRHPEYGQVAGVQSGSEQRGDVLILQMVGELIELGSDFSPTFLSPQHGCP